MFTILIHIIRVGTSSDFVDDGGFKILINFYIYDFILA